MILEALSKKAFYKNKKLAGK
jgi:hypothetical protein